jgi:hypothetical protein
LTFNGFSNRVFEHCRPSEKIRVPIETLKELNNLIEPRLKKINPRLIGHVSRTKQKGTDKYNDWAWLYYNTFETEAYRYSQLTVNISPECLYVGLCLRKHSEYLLFRNEIEKKKNEAMFDKIVKTLSGREWTISEQNEDGGLPRRYTTQELKGILLNPRIYWINACFRKNDPIVKTSKIADEIVQIFRELYNIYALASNNMTSSQPNPKLGVFKPKTIIDEEETETKTDEIMLSETREFLKSLKTSKDSHKIHLIGKNDQCTFKRKAVDLPLKPYQLTYNGKVVTIYSNRNINQSDKKIFKNYEEFHKLMEIITKSLGLPEGFLKLMYVDPKTDARYYKENASRSILLNLARYKTNPSKFFWTFAVSRELAYIKTQQLGYPFINQLRTILTIATVSK